jgi:hypothetical protein
MHDVHRVVWTSGIWSKETRGCILGRKRETEKGDPGTGVEL